MSEMIKSCVPVLLFIGNANISTPTNDDGADAPHVCNNTEVPLESPNGNVSCIQEMTAVNDTFSSGNTMRLKVDFLICLCLLQSSSSESRYGLDPATLPSVVRSIHFLLVIGVFCQLTHSFTYCIVRH